MPITALNPSEDTSLLSWAPDTEQETSPILTVMNPHVAQTLLNFDNLNLPNSTILKSAWLQLRVVANVNDPTCYVKKTRDFASDETFNSYDNDTLQQTLPTSPLPSSDTNPAGYVTFDVKGIVQEWIMFGSNKNVCLYLDDASDQSKLELSSLEGGIDPTLILEY